MKAICFLLLLGSAITITGAKPPASVPSCPNTGITCTDYGQMWFDSCMAGGNRSAQSCQWTSHQAYLECAHHGFCTLPN
jgi:hypothetical protein